MSLATAATTPVGYERRSTWWLAVLCAGLGVLPVTALLAWVFGLSAFATVFWALGAPAVVGLVIIGIVTDRRGPRRLSNALIAGVVGGLIGTAAYDLVRVPFVMAGQRVLAPIDSYGVLLLDASTSSPWTGVAGWTFHCINGIGFAIAYAVIARGRSWWWGLAWAMVLETATVVTPFADFYGLRDKPWLIVLAYGAHVPYGIAIGLAGQHADRVAAAVRRPRWPVVTVLLVAVAVSLVAWQRPFAESPASAEGRALGPGASAVIVGGHLEPEWVRVAPGGCATIRNDDPVAHTLGGGVRPNRIEAGQQVQVCADGPGIHRMKVDDLPWSGGFVIVDPSLG